MKTKRRSPAQLKANNKNFMKMRLASSLTTINQARDIKSISGACLIHLHDAEFKLKEALKLWS